MTCVFTTALQVCCSCSTVDGSTVPLMNTSWWSEAVGTSELWDGLERLSLKGFIIVCQVSLFKYMHSNSAQLYKDLSDSLQPSWTQEINKKIINLKGIVLISSSQQEGHEIDIWVFSGFSADYPPNHQSSWRVCYILSSKILVLGWDWRINP